MVMPHGVLQAVFDDDNFEYGGSQDISQKEYSLGPYKYITVEAGEVGPGPGPRPRPRVRRGVQVGILHRCGELSVLEAGTHSLSSQRGECLESAPNAPCNPLA